jgi:hypothetical protein
MHVFDGIRFFLFTDSPVTKTILCLSCQKERSFRGFFSSTANATHDSKKKFFFILLYDETGCHYADT